MPTGAKAFLVDPYQLAKSANVDHKPAWLTTLMRDMRHADVLIVDHKTGLEHHAGIVSEYRESPRRVQLPGGALHGDRPLMIVTISSAWMRIYRASLTVRYRNVLPIINQASHGATHALALHILTNAEYNRTLAQSLTEIGALRDDLSDRGRRKVLSEVLAESDLLNELGITIDRGIVYYRQHRMVHFAGADA